MIILDTVSRIQILVAWYMLRALVNASYNKLTPLQLFKAEATIMSLQMSYNDFYTLVPPKSRARLRLYSLFILVILFFPLY